MTSDGVGRRSCQYNEVHVNTVKFIFIAYKLLSLWLLFSTEPGEQNIEIRKNFNHSGQ